MANCLISEELDLYIHGSGKNFQNLTHPPTDVGRTLDVWHTADFEKRLGEIIQLVQTQIVERTRAQFTLELQSRVDSLQSRYEESKRQWESDRRAMQEEIENLRTKTADSSVPGDSSVQEEITRIKETLQRNKLELEKLMSEDPFPYAAILRLKVECQNLEAYFKGLNFQAVKSQ